MPQEIEKTYYYRGVKVELFHDDPGQQIVAIIDGQEYSMGSFNFNYEEDIEHIIDSRLDTIIRFEAPYFGAKLEYFDNGGFRDVRLTYRLRTLNIWLLGENEPIPENLQLEALNILREKVFTKD